MVLGKSTTPRPSIASETSYDAFPWWFHIFHRWIKHSPVFTRQVRFSDKKKDLPGDIDSAIKALFELYDPMKKGAFAAWWLRNAFPGISHKQKDSLCVWCDAFAAFLDTWGTIGWPQFAEVDRIVTECLGGQYEEMISRRAFSMMNYPGLNTGIALRAFTQSQDRNFIKGFWQSWKFCAGFSSSVFNRTHPGVRDFIHNLPQLSCHLPWFLQCVFCTSSCLRSDALSVLWVDVSIPIRPSLQSKWVHWKARWELGKREALEAFPYVFSLVCSWWGLVNLVWPLLADRWSRCIHALQVHCGQGVLSWCRK